MALGSSAAAPEAISPFSAAAPGSALPPGWEAIGLAGIRRPEITLVAEGGTTVLRIEAADAAGSVAHRLAADPARSPRLSWRWKVDRVVAGADLRRKEGDDYAARVYVTFDLPAEELPFLDRARIRIARLLYGAELPTAALCYVWETRAAPGTTAWNAYSSRVRMVVLRNGEAAVGEWASEARDVGTDFREAFGRPAPTISGVAVSADTDQTHERVTAWFGDLRLERGR